MGWSKALLRGIHGQPVPDGPQKLRTVHQRTTRRAVPALTGIEVRSQDGESLLYHLRSVYSPPKKSSKLRAGVGECLRRKELRLLRLPHVSSPQVHLDLNVIFYFSVTLTYIRYIAFIAPCVHNLGAYLHACETRAASRLASPLACRMMIEVKFFPSSQLFPPKVPFRGADDGSRVALIPWPGHTKSQAKQQTPNDFDGGGYMGTRASKHGCCPVVCRNSLLKLSVQKAVRFSARLAYTRYR